MYLKLNLTQMPSYNLHHDTNKISLMIVYTFN